MGIHEEWKTLNKRLGIKGGLEYLLLRWCSHFICLVDSLSGVLTLGFYTIDQTMRFYIWRAKRDEMYYKQQKEKRKYVSTKTNTNY